MSHEFETGFSVREVPWHGLGEILKDYPTSAEALKAAGLDWKVTSQPIFTDSGLEIPGYKANVRETDQKILGIVSNRYQIIQNINAFDFMDSLIGENIQWETAGSLREGKKVWMLAKTPKTQILGDDVQPYICFSNSHDGMGAINVCMTPVRVVCMNTLNLALERATRRWSTKHIGNLSMKMEEAKNTLEMADHYMSELAVKADQLANTDVSEDRIVEILNELFPVNNTDSDRKKNNVSEMKDRFMVAYYMPDITKFRNTAWGVINAAADLADHIAPGRSSETYQENNWGRIMDGHPIVDKVYSSLCVSKAV